MFLVIVSRQLIVQILKKDVETHLTVLGTTSEVGDLNPVSVYDIFKPNIYVLSVPLSTKSIWVNVTNYPDGSTCSELDFYRRYWGVVCDTSYYDSSDFLCYNYEYEAFANSASYVHTSGISGKYNQYLVNNNVYLALSKDQLSDASNTCNYTISALYETCPSDWTGYSLQGVVECLPYSNGTLGTNYSLPTTVQTPTLYRYVVAKNTGKITVTLSSPLAIYVSGKSWSATNYDASDSVCSGFSKLALNATVYNLTLDCDVPVEGDFWFTFETVEGNTTYSGAFSVAATTCSSDKAGANCEYNLVNLMNINGSTTVTLSPTNGGSEYAYFYLESTIGDLYYYNISISGNEEVDFYARYGGVPVYPDAIIIDYDMSGNMSTYHVTPYDTAIGGRFYFGVRATNAATFTIRLGGAPYVPPSTTTTTTSTSASTSTSTTGIVTTTGDAPSGVAAVVPAVALVAGAVVALVL